MGNILMLMMYVFLLPIFWRLCVGWFFLISIVVGFCQKHANGARETDTVLARAGEPPSSFFFLDCLSNVIPM
jgi:hypothetical protein